MGSKLVIHKARLLVHKARGVYPGDIGATHDWLRRDWLVEKSHLGLDSGD